jgi:hypothetical protein
MKLNKYTKQGIIKAIIRDIPEAPEAERIEEIQAALVTAMSPEVQALYATHPNALKTNSIYDVGIGYGRTVIVGDAKVKEVIAPFVAAYEKKNTLKSSLSAAIDSCNTLKQAQVMFPEFIKYMPTEESPTSNLPALANIMSDLVHMGWPAPKSAS